MKKPAKAKTKKMTISVSLDVPASTTKQKLAKSIEEKMSAIARDSKNRIIPLVGGLEPTDPLENIKVKVIERASRRPVGSQTGGYESRLWEKVTC